MRTVWTMGEHDDLLRRHQPGLKYDSMEQYFCDSAAEWTINPGNELRRADGPHALGELLASGATLTLDHLGGTHYSDGKQALDTDRIGDPKKNYREQYVALRAGHPDCATACTAMPSRRTARSGCSTGSSTSTTTTTWPSGSACTRATGR